MKYSKNTRYNWLYQFYRVMMENRNKIEVKQKETKIAEKKVVKIVK